MESNAVEAITTVGSAAWLQAINESAFIAEEAQLEDELLTALVDGSEVSEEAAEESSQPHTPFTLLESLRQYVSEQPAAEAAPAATYTREQIEKTLGQAFKNLQNGAASPSDFQAMATVAAQADGASRLGDALEAWLATPEGPARLMSLVRQATGTVDGSRALASFLARVATGNPRRTLGTLLLVTDEDGGEAVAFLFEQLAADSKSALDLATMLRSFASDESASVGLGELLETLSAPQNSDRTNSARLSHALNSTTRWQSGSREMADVFGTLIEGEGGGRSFARVLNRLTTTGTGSTDASQMLRRISFDATGTQALARLLARASESRDGARDIVTALTRIAATEVGRRDVSTIFNRLTQTELGARFLGNAAADATTAAALANLLDRVGENARARRTLETALSQVNGRHVSRFNARVSASSALQRSLASMGWTGSAPAATPSLPLKTNALGLMLRYAQVAEAV